MLVVAGPIADHPYGGLATADDESDDVLTTVEALAALPLADHTVAASVALHACLTRHGVHDPRGHARVFRRNGGLTVQLHFDYERPSDSVIMAAAVRVAGAVRQVDPWASGIDVGVA